MWKRTYTRLELCQSFACEGTAFYRFDWNEKQLVEIDKNGTKLAGGKRRKCARSVHCLNPQSTAYRGAQPCVLHELEPLERGRAMFASLSIALKYLICTTS